MPRTKKKSDKQKQEESRNRKRLYRQDAEFREKDNLRRRDERRLEREDPSFRREENQARAQRLALQKENPEFREQRNLRRREERRLERDDPSVRREENKARAERLAVERDNPNFLEQDNIRRRDERRLEREDPSFRREENQARAQRLALQKENPEFREQRNLRRREERRLEREDPSVRREENKARAERLAVERDNPYFLEQDNIRRRDERRLEREDPNVRREENKARAERLAVQQEDPEFREQRNLRRREERRMEREDPSVRREENKARAERLAVERNNPYFLEQDNIRRRDERRLEREDPSVRKEQNIARGERLEVERDNPYFIEEENLRRRNAHQEERSESDYRASANRRLDFEAAVERTRKRRRTMGDSFEKLLRNFMSLVNEGPVYICSCCGGLFYKRSTRLADRDKLLKYGCTDMVITTVLHVQQSQHRLCITCHENIRKKKKVPRVCLANGLDFPAVPNQLMNINRLEERLVSLRLPFMIISLKGYEKQWAIKGNIVNIENNVDMCVNILPRGFDQAGVVQVELKRRMDDRRAYIHDKISPAKVLRATKVLLDSPLYKKYNVVMSEDWDNFQSDEVDFIADGSVQHDVNEAESQRGRNSPGANGNDLDDERDDGEVDENPPIQETLVFQDDDFFTEGYRVAPGEGRNPIPLFMDADAERLSFPSIYCGEAQPSPPPGVKLSTVDRELRRYDRRAAKPEKVLYSFRKSSNEQIRNAFNICLRQKTKGSSSGPLLAKDVRSKEDVSNIIAKNDAYSVYKNVRCTAAYWLAQQKRVVSMIRQLGTCTFFVTLTAAETKWKELLVILTKVLRNQDITQEDAGNLSYAEKAKLISSDPVTCMRHFDHKYKALLNELFKKENGIFEPHRVGDYYSRVEFQMRGSPHSHGLYRLRDSPVYDSGSEESKRKVVEFIDAYITCKRDEEEEMDELIGYQIHKHSDTCKKGKKGLTCRFHFPRPPMPATVILQPLPTSVSNKEKKSFKDLYKKVENKLIEYGRSFKEDIPFENFLNSLEIDEDSYYAAIRSTLERDTVFLKRRTNEIYINNYNKRLLLAWKANMDIQFVLDAYACAKYCASYINKSDPGVSKLLKAVMRDAKNGNKSAVECLKQFAKILMTRTEISAQEAAAFLLGLPSTFSSRTEVYINTAEPDKRVGILKSREELDVFLMIVKKFAKKDCLTIM